MNSSPTLADLKDAYRNPWITAAAPWAQDALRRGVYTLLEGRELPAYAIILCKNAIKHMNGVASRCERETRKAEEDMRKQFNRGSHKRNYRAVERGREEYARRHGMTKKKG